MLKFQHRTTDPSLSTASTVRAPVWSKAALKLAGCELMRYLAGHMAGWKARGMPLQSIAENEH